VPPGSFRGTGRGDCIGDPNVSIGVDIDAVRPYEHAATEALHHIAIQVELDDRVQVRIETFIAETFGRAGVTADDCPYMFAIGIYRHITDCAHLSPIGQFRPAIDQAIRVWERLSKYRRCRAERDDYQQSRARIYRM
jgi:hypothetical protein